MEKNQRINGKKDGYWEWYDDNGEISYKIYYVV